MFYKRRELRRLWEIELYDGDPEDPSTTTHKETIVAWNQVDAIRHGGDRVVKQPRALHFVTWADGDDNIYRIDDTSVGPFGEPIVPSVVRSDPGVGD